jgi:hypothetical protein
LVDVLFEVGVSSADLPPSLAKKTVVSGNRSDVGQPWNREFQPTSSTIKSGEFEADCFMVFLMFKWVSRGKNYLLYTAKCQANIYRIYQEVGEGERVALLKLAAESLEKQGRPLRIAIDIAIWQFQNQAAQGISQPLKYWSASLTTVRRHKPRNSNFILPTRSSTGLSSRTYLRF